MASTKRPASTDLPRTRSKKGFGRRWSFEIELIFIFKEFELVKNAFYTEPADQSAWLYHRWLVDKSILQYILLKLNWIILSVGRWPNQNLGERVEDVPRTFRGRTRKQVYPLSISKLRLQGPFWPQPFWWWNCLDMKSKLWKIFGGWPRRTHIVRITIQIWAGNF